MAEYQRARTSSHGLDYVNMFWTSKVANISALCEVVKAAGVVEVVAAATALELVIQAQGRHNDTSAKL